MSRIVTRPRIDPATKDLIIINGQLDNDDTHVTTVLFLIDHQRGTSAAYPNTGSRYHTIKKILPNTLKTVELMTLEAIDSLIKSNKITNVNVETSRVNNTRIQVNINWIDSRGQKKAIKRILKIGK